MYLQNSVSLPPRGQARGFPRILKTLKSILFIVTISFTRAVCLPARGYQNETSRGKLGALYYNNFSANYDPTTVLAAGFPRSVARFTSPLAHVHLKGFIVDDNKSLCRLAGTPWLAALCSADSRWPGKTTAPTPFSRTAGERGKR